jgi:hypothetical protein
MTEADIVWFIGLALGTALGFGLGYERGYYAAMLWCINRKD